MNKKRTDKCGFKSNYGGGWISNAQRVMEVFCEIIASQQKKELPDMFWKVGPWNKLFRTQIPAANCLLKKYPIEVVINTLRDRRVSNRIQSLRANWILEPVLEEKMKEYKIKNQEVKEEREKTSVNQKPRGGLSGGKSLLEQLKGL